MKKIYLTTLFIFSFLLSFGQLDMSFGISSYALRTNQNSDIGFGFGLNLKHFHWDISHNISNSKNNYILYNGNIVGTSYGVTNDGYNIYASKDFVVTPVIGYGWTNTEYVSMVNFYGYPNYTNFYYFGYPTPHLNLGILLTKYGEKVGFGVGLGTFEIFKFNINIKLIN